jgi:hypothetical protein
MHDIPLYFAEQRDPTEPSHWRLATIDHHQRVQGSLVFLASILNPPHPSPMYSLVPSKLRSSNLHIICSQILVSYYRQIHSKIHPDS